MLLAIALFACADAPHATLHPAGADLWIQVPDVGAVLAAYANAPAVKLVESEGAANIAALAKEMGFDLAATASSLLPVADPERASDRWWPWSAARRASCSISGIERGPKTGEAAGDVSAWIVCDFSAPDAAEQAAKAIIATGGREPKPMGEIAVGDAKTTAVEIGSPFASIAPKAWLARFDTRIVVGAGAAQPADYVARATATTGGMLDAWNASANDKTLGAAKGVTVVDLLADFDDLPSFVDDSAAFSYAAVFLAPFLAAKGRWRIELQGDRFVTDAVYQPRGKATEVLSTFGTKPVDAATVAFVPPDAVGTWITDVDAAKAEAAFGAFLQSDEGRAIAAPADGEPRLADGLKSGMAMSLLPFQSLMSPTPRLLLALELSDAAKFQAGLDAWIARAQTAIPDLQVERKPYRKVPTITLGAGADEAEGAGGGGPLGGMSIEPSRVTIAVLADRVLLASAPSVARNEIKRLQDKADVAPHELTSKAARPADAFEVSTMDWGAFLSKLYDGVRGFAPMLAQNLGKPVDLEKLPSAAQLFAPFRPTTSWARRVEGRIQLHSESSFGPETPLAIAGIGMLAARGATKVADAVVERVATDATAKAVTEAAADDARNATLAALREVRTAIAVYRTQFGRAPAAAAELLKKTDAFPDGFLKSGKVPADGWGRELVYSAASDGATYSLHSTGVDGVDQQGAGDDVRLP